MKMRSNALERSGTALKLAFQNRYLSDDNTQTELVDWYVWPVGIVSRSLGGGNDQIDFGGDSDRGLWHSIDGVVDGPIIQADQLQPAKAGFRERPLVDVGQPEPVRVKELSGPERKRLRRGNTALNDLSAQFWRPAR